MKKRHLWAQRAFGLLVLAAAFVAMVGANKSPVAAALKRGERIPILLFGIDAADASQHTDTLMVSVCDPLQNSLSLLSIPRDTRVNLPGYIFHRVNEIYGFHFRRTKSRLTAAMKVKEGVEYLLSPENKPITIPYYLQIDFSGFIRMMDILGGVWVTIKQPMHYDDSAGNYHFHKEPGRYFLTGKEALFYVRFRGSTGDKGRIFRQQEFLRNIAKQLANPLVVMRVPKLVEAVASSVYTNLSFWDFVYLTAANRRLRSDNIGFYILPGTPRGVFWHLNSGAVKRLAAKTILGEKVNVDDVETIVPLEEHITVKVWNASGQKGLARFVTKHLRQCGYDVLDWENYALEQLPTRVVDRVGQISKARAVADDLGIDNFHSEVNSKSLVDVDVILGKNFSGAGIVDREQAVK